MIDEVNNLYTKEYLITSEDSSKFLYALLVMSTDEKCITCAMDAIEREKWKNIYISSQFTYFSILKEIVEKYVNSNERKNMTLPSVDFINNKLIIYYKLTSYKKEDTKINKQIH